jgi:translation initiation factor 5B
VAVKIESTNATEASRLFGRHFDDKDELMSKVTRESINALKKHFRDEMSRPEWELIIRLKKVFKID